MELIRFGPLDLAGLRERINRLFEEFVSTPRQPSLWEDWTPLVDIYETESEMVVRAELAGLSQKDMEVELSGDTLTIRGQRQLEKDRDYLRVERPHGSFKRAFTIGVPIQPAGVRARYRDGILQINLPKAAEPEPKQVKVKVE